MPSVAKVMGKIFWDAEGLILAEFLERGQIITAARYVQTLHKVLRTLRDTRPRRNIIILHDNARPHAVCFKSEAIAKIGWEVLPHPSYSPDLAPSDYHLFGFVKDQLRGQRYYTTEAIQKAVVSVFGWLVRSSTAEEFLKFQNAGRNVYKEVAIMWINKENYLINVVNLVCQ